MAFACFYIGDITSSWEVNVSEQVETKKMEKLIMPEKKKKKENCKLEIFKETGEWILIYRWRLILDEVVQFNHC